MGTNRSLICYSDCTSIWFTTGTIFLVWNVWHWFLTIVWKFQGSSCDRFWEPSKLLAINKPFLDVMVLHLKNTLFVKSSFLIKSTDMLEFKYIKAKTNLFRLFWYIVHNHTTNLSRDTLVYVKVVLRYSFCHIVA